MTIQPWIRIITSLIFIWFLIEASVATGAAAQPRDEFLNRATNTATTVQTVAASTNAPNQGERIVPGEGSTGGHNWDEIAFSCAVLVFGLILVAIEAVLLFKGKLQELSGFKLIGLTIVVTAGLFVIPAGYSQNQMTPLMGLLGAIAGYLLGKDVPQDGAGKH